MRPASVPASRKGPREGIGRALSAVLLTLLCSYSSAIKPTDYFHLKDLEKERSMTPEQFANLFERFFYEFHPRLKEPEEFLVQRAGDCDDYAVLGAYILGMKGHKTRLMQVQLTGDNVDHAVLFVIGNNVYLDYNNRKLRYKLVKSGPTLRDVAALVAASFKQSWTTAFEFTYTYEEPWKTVTRVVVKTDPPERDVDRMPASQQGQPRP